MATVEHLKNLSKRQCVHEIGLKGFEAGKLTEQDLDKSRTYSVKNHLRASAVSLQSLSMGLQL